MKRQWLIELRGDRLQQDVAKESGISQNHYSWIEAGHRTPSVQTAKRIADVLGFKWTRFFDEEKKTG